jgi:hypothetical protein
MTVRSITVPLAALFLTACGGGQSEAGPGGVSAEDAKALDEAAAKLDAEAAGELQNHSENAD